jgi:Transposase DDE domain group 1
MHTDCRQDSFDFGTVEGRRVVSAFDGGPITSHAGGLLLGASKRAIRLVERLARCFRDGRDPDALLHTVPALLGQRIFAIALGLRGHQRSRPAAARPGAAGTGGQAHGHQPRTIFRHAPGLNPTRRVNTREKWLWSAKPHACAIVDSDASGF